MNNYSKHHSKTELCKVVGDVADIARRVIGMEVAVMTTTGVPLTKNNYQSVVGLFVGLTNQLKNKSPNQSRLVTLVSDEVLRMSYAAEMQSCGAGFWFMKSFSESPTQPAKETTVAQLPTKQELHGALSDQLGETTAEIIMKSISLSGLEGTVVVDVDPATLANKSTVVIDKTNGYEFALSALGIKRQSTTDKPVWDRRNGAKLLVVDGIVDRLADVDRLLIWASKVPNTPVCILARGFDDEVVGTVAVNNSRAVFDVALLKPTDVESLSSLNVLGDVCVVTGADPVTVLKGDILSLVDHTRFTDVPSVQVNNSNTRCRFTTTKDRVNQILAHVSALREKRKAQLLEASHVTDLADLTTDRIKHLCGNVVRITVGSEKEKTDLDTGLRLAKAMCSYGIIQNTSTPKLSEYVGSFYGKKLRQLYSDEDVAGAVVLTD